MVELSNDEDPFLLEGFVGAVAFIEVCVAEVAVAVVAFQRGEIGVIFAVVAHVGEIFLSV